MNYEVQFRNFVSVYIMEPFRGLRVIELANVLAGPAVGMFFAELGAEVIKIENILTGGDVTRTWKLSSENPQTEISAYFSTVNWGKRSVALDLTDVADLFELYRLVSAADIVLTSYKPGDAEKLKVDYASLKSINPGIIYGQITGYGQEDSRVGYDAVIQAESGFAGINGTNESGPLKMPVALMDILAAHHLKEGILVALYKKERTGTGDLISVSLFDAAVTSLANQAVNWLVAGFLPQRIGSEHPNIVPYGSVFITRDDHELIVAVGTEKQFIGLCIALNIPELVERHEFSSNQMRVANKTALLEILREAFKEFTLQEILHRLHQRQVPAGAIRTIEEVFSLPESQKLILTNGTQKGLKTIGFSAEGFSTVETLSPPPELGDHNDELLAR